MMLEATVTSLSRATRVIKRMELQGLECDRAL